MKKSFTFRADVSTLETLRFIATTNNIAVGTLIRNILEDWIKER